MSPTDRTKPAGRNPASSEPAVSLHAELVEQIDQHVLGAARPRLEGLTDQEYLYDPAGGGRAWTVHPRLPDQDLPEGAIQGGAGDTVIDFAFPEPQPAPFTTIAWRLGHLIVGVLAVRSHAHLDGPEADYMTWDYATNAAEALAQFDREYERWMSGVRAWSEEDLQVPCGPAEGPYAQRPRAALVAHINRELIHHLAEVAVLRDLYAHRS
ncbi:DinB family protein [Brachybacterium sp. p3-SID1565]|uniref:DinB family protein n=1 Tax=Brachybacterium epidermidis TaxID=2781983 RepID=A0ABR9W135_9MICO|nr:MULTISPECIES: DinB family protein [Brachybacterium]MBE9403155.1 DinB family protein [Brachybacterium epidermidis]MCT1385768.1 DinB family protein [Brachybacterium sp. p3-SID1565]